MKISELAIRRAVATSMMYVLVVLLGGVAITKLPLEFMPQMDIPFVDIHIPYEGASPVEVCDRIGEPVEEALATLPGIKKMRTRCSPGYAYIGLELSGKAKMDYMVLDIQERIDAIRADLPSDIDNIWIQKFDTEQFPVIFGAITFAEDKSENNELIDRHFIRPLKTVDGVAAVMVEGLEYRKVLVEIDQNKLTSYGINVLQVFDVLASANMTQSAGSVDFAGRRHSVRIVGEFKDLDAIRALPVTSAIKVGDVAEVRMDHEKPFFVGRFNKRRAYMVMILKESGVNTVGVCTDIKERLDKILDDQRLKGVEFKIWFDQSREIVTSISVLTKTGAVGAVLAFFVLWVFLKNFRSTAIVASAIPMSILGTIAGMFFLGLNFNMVTISALIVGVGMLVDNSIVVLEAIDLHHRQGASPFTAAIEGAKEVGLAISVATSTTIIVFLPLIFTEQSAASILMKQMGLVLALSIGSSLVVSLTLIPLLASRLLQPVSTGLPRWYQRLSDAFIATLSSGLDHRLPTILIMTAGFLISVQIFIWPTPWDSIEGIKENFKFYKLIEKEAVPSAMMRLVRINVHFDHKPPLEEIDGKMAKLEDLFFLKKEEWGLDTIAAIVTPRFTHLLLVLPDVQTPKYSAEEIKDLASDFIAENIHWPGVRVELSGEGQGGPPGMGGQSTSIKVRGPDPNQVLDFAELIRERLMGVPGLEEIKEIERDQEHEVHVMVDRDQARQYGFDVSQVAMAVSYSIRGVPVGQFYSGDTPLDIYIQLDEADRKTLNQLESMNIQNMRAEYIPLKNVARFKMVPIPDRVRRDNRLNTVRIPIVPEGKDLGVVSKHVHERLKNFRLPMGYSWVVGEEFQEVKEDLTTLAKAIVLAMILVFLVMTAQFESFFLPFVVMFTLPFATIGVVFALLISRATFNVLSGAGCLLLVGIVVNNAIVLVDHIHNLRKKGLGDKESLLQASADRFRPIMMTALTTIVGLLPMAMGVNDTGRMMYSPLGIAVLGGLVVSTFLTPFVIPIIYSLTDDLVRWFRQLWRMMVEV